MISDVSVLVVALVVLVKGSDVFVEYAARLARRFEVSDLVVGLVVTSVGTSLPELSSSLAASLSKSSALVIGNVVGSNIANIGLVLGVAAWIRPLATEVKMHDRDGFVLVATAVVFFVMALDNRIGRLEASGLLCVYALYVVFAVRSDREGAEHRFKDFLEFMFGFEYAAPVVRRLTPRGRGSKPAAVAHEPRDGRIIAREMGAVVLSLAAVIGGARFVISSSIGIARVLEIPENLVGLSIVAVGTSLPELLVAISAARRGRAEMVVGSVMGSNIANGLLIVGLSGLARPLDVPELSVVYTIPIMLFFSLGLLYFIRSDWRMTRRQGVVAVMGYVAFLTAAFIQGWG